MAQAGALNAMFTNLAHGAQMERLELGAADTPSAGDPALATVGTRHRPANG
jgi:hypothetical protein